MNTAVVILNWNGLNHLQTYLPSVVKFSNAHIYIIDNGSSDNSVNWIKGNHPEIGIVQLDKNLGFAGGYNAGLKKIDAERYVLLNSDVRVSAGWIESVNKTMSEKGWSICSPIIFDDKKPEYYEYAGAAGGYIDKDGYMFCAGRLFDSFEKSNPTYNTDREVFWASGAALFVESIFKFQKQSINTSEKSNWISYCFHYKETFIGWYCCLEVSVKRRVQVLYFRCKSAFRLLPNDSKDSFQKGKRIRGSK